MIAFYESRDERLFIGEITKYPFPLHVHELAEIIGITSGFVRISINGTEYTLNPGDVAVIFPLTPHSYDEIGEDASGQVAIVPTDIIPEYTSTFRTLEPEYPILRAADAPEDTALALNRLQALNMEDHLPLCIAYLHVLLASTMHRLSYHPVYDYSDRGLGHRIMRYISDHLCEEITLKPSPMPLASAFPICPIFLLKRCMSISGSISMPTALPRPGFSCAIRIIPSP